MAWSSSESGRTVRVSYSALLRIKDDDRYVLFGSGSRPGAFTPPGGVIKYFAPAADFLEHLDFRADRWVERAAGMRGDLRGLLPARHVPEFRRWFASGAYRECAQECLVREMTEELAEVGFPELAAYVPALRFAPLRTKIEGPTAVPGKPYAQLRRFEFYDLVCSDRAAHDLKLHLVGLADDPSVTTVLGATAEDIVHGRAGAALIAPHSAFLIGEQRVLPDIPSLR